MTITIFIAEKPSAKEDCDTAIAHDVRRAKVMLWALAKQAKPEWAYCWLPMGLEPFTNDGMRHRDAPSEIAEAVENEVSRQNKLAMQDYISEALNGAYEDLARTFGSCPEFVEILTDCAREWAQECIDNAGQYETGR